MNLNQDGSDRRTPRAGGRGRPAATRNEQTRTLPCAMSLRLLDSKDGPIASKLAPFAQSYDEAILQAVGAFQKHLPSGTVKPYIVLKYPCKALDGTVYWSDLEAAKESREMWMRLMTLADAERIPEVGVFIEDELPIEPGEPLIRKNGRPVKVRIYDFTRSKWIISYGSSSTSPPPTYQGFVEYTAQLIEAAAPGDPRRILKGRELRNKLQFDIWNRDDYSTTPLTDQNYREMMQNCPPTSPFEPPPDASPELVLANASLHINVQYDR